MERTRTRPFDNPQLRREFGEGSRHLVQIIDRNTGKVLAENYQADIAGGVVVTKSSAGTTGSAHSMENVIVKGDHINLKDDSGNKR